MKIIVSAGGTGGHIYPALAIIKKFQEKEKNLEVLYIGTHNRMEKDIVPEMGIKYEALEIYGFSKTDLMRDFIHFYHLFCHFYIINYIFYIFIYFNCTIYDNLNTSFLKIINYIICGYPIK